MSMLACGNMIHGTEPYAHAAYASRYVPQTQQVTTDTPSSGGVRRMAGVTDSQHHSLSVAWERDNNLYEICKALCSSKGEQRAMAFRTVTHVEKTTIPVAASNPHGPTKQWEFLHMTSPFYVSYSQLWEYIQSFGKGLAALDVVRQNTQRARIAIYEDTRWEWLASCYGIWSQGCTVVTVYANLGLDALEYALREAACSAIVCSSKSLPSLKSVLEKLHGASSPCPTVIVLDEMLVPSSSTQTRDVKSLMSEFSTSINVKVVTWTEVIQIGATAQTTGSEPIASDDIALIMYTSGTTGEPKGVVISHGNVMAATRCLGDRLLEVLGPIPPSNIESERETYVCYLPLAHILEFSCENLFLSRGSCLCYGTPRTLTSATAKPSGDLATFEPSLFVGVPRIFDTLKKSIEANIPEGYKRRVWDHAFQDRKTRLLEGFDTPYWGKKVFAEPRKIFGTKLLAMISGGAPLSARTQEFMNVVFSAPMLQGWGLTETCSCGTTQRNGDFATESIGQLERTVEVKLVDVDDWKHNNKPFPQGEICIRGPFVSKGYYKQPAMTNEAFRDDGWFHTGDVGQWGSEGELRIVGRVKALAKNVFGEYVALDALESVYILNPLAVPNGVCVLVDPSKPYICALVVTDEHKATSFARSVGIEEPWPQLLDNPRLHEKAAESLATTAKTQGKKPFEQVKYVRVLKDEWTPENGVLTAAMKLKRRVVDAKYADVIKVLFKSE